MVLVLVAALTAAQLPADAPRESDSLAVPRARLAEVDSELRDLRGRSYDITWPIIGCLFGVVPAIVAGVVVDKSKPIGAGQAVAVLALVGMTVSIEILSVVVIIKNKIGAVVRDARVSSLSIERSVIQREIEAQQREARPPPPPAAPPLVPSTL